MNQSVPYLALFNAYNLSSSCNLLSISSYLAKAVASNLTALYSKIWILKFLWIMSSSVLGSTSGFLCIVVSKLSNSFLSYSNLVYIISALDNNLSFNFVITSFFTYCASCAFNSFLSK